MIGRIVIGLLVHVLLTTIDFAAAQQTKKVPRIGYLSSRFAIEPREEAFRKGLSELGYVEGQNIVIEWRFAEGKRERQTSLAADLVRLNVECIIATGASAVHAATTESSQADQLDDPAERVSQSRQSNPMIGQSKIENPKWLGDSAECSSAGGSGDSIDAGGKHAEKGRAHCPVDMAMRFWFNG
jgi:hypothetical protein